MCASSDDSSLPGLKEKKVGLGFASDLGKYLKIKAKNFINNQIRDVAEDITKNDVSLTRALKNKVAAVKNKVKRAGRGIRKRRKKVKGRKPNTRKRIYKKGKRRTRKRRRTRGGKKRCYKGTIFV